MKETLKDEKNEKTAKRTDLSLEEQKGRRRKGRREKEGGKKIKIFTFRCVNREGARLPPRPKEPPFFFLPQNG